VPSPPYMKHWPACISRDLDDCNTTSRLTWLVTAEGDKAIPAHASPGRPASAAGTRATSSCLLAVALSGIISWERLDALRLSTLVQLADGATDTRP